MPAYHGLGGGSQRCSVQTAWFSCLVADSLLRRLPRWSRKEEPLQNRGDPSAHRRPRPRPRARTVPLACSRYQFYPQATAHEATLKVRADSVLSIPKPESRVASSRTKMTIGSCLAAKALCLSCAELPHMHAGRETC